MTMSIHDHHIHQLTVDARQRTVLIRTSYPYPGTKPPEPADVLFEGVAGYVLNGDALGTILFDIEAVDSLTLYREHAGEMQQSCKRTGGHAPWADSESSAAAFFSREEVRGYQITSSIGLEGAVWARQMTISPARAT